METWRHTQTFEGLEVRDYDPRQRGLGDPATTCPRVYPIVDDVTPAPPVSKTRKVAAAAVFGLTLVGVIVWSWIAVVVGLVAITTLLSPGRPPGDRIDRDLLWKQLFAEPRLRDVQAIVFGPWFAEVDEGPDELIRRLVDGADKLPGLRAIFLGDVVSEECEISWIQQGDLTPLLAAFPDLETLVVRGGTGLRFTNLDHRKLRKLVVQSGGLDPLTIADLCDARLPALEHLELWLGDPNYGFESTVDDLRPLWAPSKFAKLQTLGLRNCHIADAVAEALATSPGAVGRLTRLDLSLGTLSDLGAQALFNNKEVLELEHLDLHHHYLSDDWMEKLATLPIDLDTSDPQGFVDPEDDEDLRYVAISE